VDALVKLGKDKDASVRAAACTAMGGIRPDLAGGAKIVLREAMKDPEAAVRDAAEAALNKLGG
jgi:HEAT repeat protein